MVRQRSIMNIHCSLLFTLILLIISGCNTTKPLYYWGNYESSIYYHYADSSASPNKEIEALRKDEINSRESGLPLPPGYHAYLGYLYFQSGNQDLAHNEFLIEKKRFPGSALLMERLLKK